MSTNEQKKNNKPLIPFNCLICGTEFIRTKYRWAAKTCSTNCSMKYKKKKRRERERKKYEIASKNRPPRICVICKKDFFLKGRGNRTKTCLSGECKKEYKKIQPKGYYTANKSYWKNYYLKNKEKIIRTNRLKNEQIRLGRSLPEIISCLICQKKFDRTKGGRWNAKTCSPECSLQLKTKTTRKVAKKTYQKRKQIKTLFINGINKVCVVCNREFWGRGKTCSLECRKVNNCISARQSNTRWKETQTLLKKGERFFVNCIICNKRFDKKGTKNICSLECKRKRWAQLSKFRHLMTSQCKSCLKRFKKPAPNTRFCSPNCRKERYEQLSEKGKRKLEQMLRVIQL